MKLVQPLSGANHKSTRKLGTSLLSAIMFGAVIAPTSAQERPIYSDYDNQRVNEVVVYSECDFRGEARRISVGEHSKIQNLGFRNDDMSSIRIPNGVEVTIYEDSKFRGAYARLNRDIRCFDRSWDNQVSSLKVVGARYSDNNARDYHRDRDRYNDNRYDNRNDRSEFPRRTAVNARNLGFVAFSNSELRKANNGLWTLGNRNQFDGVTELKVLSQDASSIYLQSTVSNERIRIDLNNNRVTYYANNGLSQNYPITQKQAGTFAQSPSTVREPAPSRYSGNINQTIRGECFTYKAYSNGGDAGVRFHGKPGFERFNSRPITGKVCNSGDITMEVNKRDTNTDVTIEIQGNQYRFAPREKETQYLNNWYRKHIKLVINN